MRWDSDALWKKAQVYMDRANQFHDDGTDFPLWSALALELLARSALTKIHPALNADPREDINLLYACGFPITSQPKSLPLHAVFLRLEKTVAGFGSVQRELCDYISLLRNDELHSAGLPFENLKESSWLPRYYEVCHVLCAHLGKSLSDLLGPEVAASAERLIAALDRRLQKSVKDRIAAHAKVFNQKSQQDRQKLQTDAEIRARHLPNGSKPHACPACNNSGALGGELIKEMKPVYEDEVLLIDQEFLAANFRCFACDLQLHNPEELAHSGIEPRFSGQRITDLHELFEPEEPDPYMNM